MSSSDEEIYEISSTDDEKRTCTTMSSSDEQIIEISSTDDEERDSNYVNCRAQRSPTVFKPRPIRKAAQLASKRFKTHLPTSSQWEEDIGINFKERNSKLPSRNRGHRKFCHSCRKNRLEPSAQCSLCYTAFCERCLNVRHGENIFEVSKSELQWVCPRCRKGCGSGCEACCCTCSRCCLNKGTQPRDQAAGKKIIRDAQSAGFSLHDYLIHLETRESREEIAKRKRRWVWTAASSKCTSTEATELKSDNCSAEQEALGPCQNEAEIGIKSEDCRPLDDRRHNDKIRQIEPNEFGVACDEKEIPQEKINIEGRNGKNGNDPGRLHTKEEFGTRGKALSDCEVAIVALEERFYFMELLWSDRDIELIGDKLSITLRDRDVKLRNAIKARSPANGITHIFNSTLFKDQTQDEKNGMKKLLKDCMRRHFVDYNQRAIQIQENVVLHIEGITENMEKAADAIPSGQQWKLGNYPTLPLIDNNEINAWIADIWSNPIEPELFTVLLLFVLA